MGIETTYEIRIIVGGKITHRRFIDDLYDLYTECRSLSFPTQAHIFRISKDENGNIVSSNKLDCTILGNSFVLNTVKEKPRRVLKDDDKNELLPGLKKVQKEVYDIEFLKTISTRKRILPSMRLSPTNPSRLEKLSEKTEDSLPSRSGGSEPETTPRTSSKIQRGDSRRGTKTSQIDIPRRRR